MVHHVSFLILPRCKVHLLTLGPIGSPYGCDSGEQCIFLAPVDKLEGAVGCCSGGTCNFKVACVDRADMDDCDKDCRNDPATLKW